MKNIAFLMLILFLSGGCNQQENRSYQFSQENEIYAEMGNLKEIEARIEKIKDLEKKGDHLKANQECSILMSLLSHIHKDTTDRSQGLTNTVLNFFVSPDAPDDFKKMFRKAAVENSFPKGALETFNLWKGGFLTKESSDEFIKDMITMADGIPNPYIKQAVEETGMMKRIRGKMESTIGPKDSTSRPNRENSADFN